MRVWGGLVRAPTDTTAASGMSTLGRGRPSWGELGPSIPWLRSLKGLCCSEDKDKAFQGGQPLCMTWPMCPPTPGFFHLPHSVLATEATGPLHEWLLPLPRMFLPSHLCSGTPTHVSVPDCHLLQDAVPKLPKLFGVGFHALFQVLSFSGKYTSIWASGRMVSLSLSAEPKRVVQDLAYSRDAAHVLNERTKG